MTNEIIATMTRQQYKSAWVCTAKKDVRPYLNGIHISKDNSEIVSTDGSILYFADIDPGEAICDIIFEPAKLPAYTDKVVIRTHDTYHVITEAWKKGKLADKFTCKLIDGTYPDYKSAIPSDNVFNDSFNTVCWGAFYLAKLEKVFGRYPIRFDISNPLNACTITRPGKPGMGKVILMPVRMS